MEKIIPKSSLNGWISKLTDYTVYAPVKDENRWRFEIVRSFQGFDIHYSNSHVPPKQHFFPQLESLLEFSQPNGAELEFKETPPDSKPIILFGIRPCDGNASARLRSVFSKDFPDPYVLKRLEDIIMVGFGCVEPPSGNCFCTAVNGSPHSKQGLDILVTDLGDDYYFESLSLKGDQLMDLFGEAFRQAKEHEKASAEKVHIEAREKLERKINGKEQLAARLDQRFESPFWEQEAHGCIRCGICTYLCPSCHCFDMNDEVHSRSPLKGRRVRTWDTCQFPDFTMHSSGHNPRPDKASRLRRRIFHKFRYPDQEKEDYNCTGCGRCISLCPAGIDIVEILNKVNSDE